MEEVHLRISGGLMGLTISGTVDIASLEKNVREQCRRQLDKKKLKAATAEAKSLSMPDSQEYQLTLKATGRKVERFQFNETQAAPELLEVIDILRAKIIGNKIRERKNDSEPDETAGSDKNECTS